MTSIRDLLPPAYFEAFRDAATGAVQELWLPGGRYSGKSTFVARCIAALEATRGFEDCHAACFRRHQVDIRESIGTELQLAVDALGVGGLWAVKHSPFRLVRRDTGQTIFFYGLDDPRKHKSKKPPFGSVRWLWFEEADEFDCWDDIENVQNSFQRNGEVFQTFVSFNPPRSSASWINAETARRATGRRVYHTDYRDLADVGLVPKQILERIEECKRLRPEIYRHVYLGEVTGTGGEIFTNVRDVTLSDEQVAEMRRRASYGMDFGIVNDPTVLVGTWYDRDRDYLYIFDECVLKHPYYTTIYDALKRKGLAQTEITADTAPAGWIQNINSLGARLRGCYKAEDWPETGVSWLRSRTRICIDSARAPLAWDEFVHYEYDTYANGKPKEKLPDRENHAIDATRYATEADIKASAIKRFVGAPVAMTRRY